MNTGDEQHILQALARSKQPMAISELRAALPQSMSERTLRRRLLQLVNSGQVIAEGEHKGRRYCLAHPRTVTTAHPFFSEESLAILNKTQMPIYQRQPCSYQSQWLAEYLPNETFYLTFEQRQLLNRQGLILSEKAADTYTQQIFNRILIDLSYNSSRLEGNTYSLLETQQLVIAGESAANKLDAEKIMILNHKEAIKYLVEGNARISLNSETIQTMHYLLADGLIQSEQAGQVRDEMVRISSTTYMPLEGKQKLTQLLAMIADKAQQITNPFEQSFFLLVHISYLQAFIDVNKRTARLCANIPLVQHYLAPLAFNDITKDDYISAIIAVYELNAPQPLTELYVWSYLRSCKLYQTTAEAIGLDPIRVRYRQQRRQLTAYIIQHQLVGNALQQYVHRFTLDSIPEADRAVFQADILRELATLEPFKIAGMGVSLQEFTAWKHKRDALR